MRAQQEEARARIQVNDMSSPQLAGDPYRKSMEKSLG